MAIWLAAAAIILCLLSPAIPAYLAGDARLAMPGLVLAMAAVAAAIAAWRLHQRRQVHSPKDEHPDLRLLEDVAGALRDPLTTLTGFSELLVMDEDRPRDGPEIREACRFILETSGDLNVFVANLQDFVRHEQGRMSLVEQRVDAAELVEAALGPCRRTAERADVVIMANLLEGVELCCDPGRIRSAVANIVLWAAGEAPAGSVIGVKLVRLAGEAAAIAVTSMARPGKDSMFEPRLALHGVNGLALPIARRVALRHSGDLTIDSVPGAGSIARLILPAYRVTWPDVAESRDGRAA